MTVAKTKMTLELSNPIFASRMRKKFNRRNGHPHLGDIVKIGKNVIGEFHGISTYSQQSRITVHLYETGNKKPTKELPKIFEYEGHRIPVVPTWDLKPKISYRDW